MSYHPVDEHVDEGEYAHCQDNQLDEAFWVVMVILLDVFGKAFDHSLIRILFPSAVDRVPVLV